MNQAKSRLAKLPKAWITKRQEVAEDLMIVWLRPEVPFTFNPGQYITIGKEGIERPYSIVSAPHEATVELFIEHVLPEHHGHLTPILWGLQAGDYVSMRPRAKGVFLFQPEYHNHLMIGTVTGIAPFVSIIRSAIHEKLHGHRFFVMEGASHQDEFGYDRELTRLAGNYPDTISYIATVSRPHAERNEGWQGPSGRVNTLVEAYLDRWSLPRDDTLIYLCGNPGMIDDVTLRLTPQGWRLQSERFWKEAEQDQRL